MYWQPASFGNGYPQFAFQLYTMQGILKNTGVFFTYVKFGLDILGGFEKLQFLYVLLRSYLIKSYSKLYHSFNKQLPFNK